jgi:hypothetical protein
MRCRFMCAIACELHGNRNARPTHDANGILQILTSHELKGEDALGLRTRKCRVLRFGQVTICSPGTEINESASAPCTEMVSPALLK